jgi:hypothetical protein
MLTQGEDVARHADQMLGARDRRRHSVARCIMSSVILTTVTGFVLLVGIILTLWWGGTSYET